MPAIIKERPKISSDDLPSLDNGMGTGSPYKVIVYNDDVHTFDEVANQIVKATGCDIEKAHEHARTVDKKGRDVVFDGEQKECEKVANILREIRLQVETDH